MGKTMPGKHDGEQQSSAGNSITTSRETSDQDATPRAEAVPQSTKEKRKTSTMDKKRKHDGGQQSSAGNSITTSWETSDQDATPRAEAVSQYTSSLDDELLLWKLSERMNRIQAQQLGEKLGMPSTKLENLKDKVLMGICSQEEMNFEMLHKWNANQVPDGDPEAKLRQMLRDLEIPEKIIQEIFTKENHLHQSTQERELNQQQLFQIAEKVDKSQHIPIVLRLGLNFNDFELTKQRCCSRADQCLFTLLHQWQKDLPPRIDQIETISSVLSASEQKRLAHNIRNNCWNVISGDKGRSIMLPTRETCQTSDRFCDKDLIITCRDPAKQEQMLSNVKSVFDRCSSRIELSSHGETYTLDQSTEKAKKVHDECQDVSRFLNGLQEAGTQANMYEVIGVTNSSIILHVRVYSEEGLRRLKEDIDSGAIGRRLASVLMLHETGASSSDDVILDVALAAGTIDQISQQLASVLMLHETGASSSDDEILDITLAAGTIDQISQQSAVKMADGVGTKNTEAGASGGMLEVDCIVTSPGNGYYDASDGSQISRPQNLTVHPPAANGIIADGECRLVSNIVRDGSEDDCKRLDKFIQRKQRIMEEMDMLNQTCEDLFLENEQLRAENGQLRAEMELCRNSRLSSNGPNERTKEEETLQRKLDEARNENAQLKHRCQELLGEVARLENRSCDGAEDNLQYTSNVESREGSLTTPRQTDSVGIAIHSVDPLIEAVREGRQEVERSRVPGEAPEGTGRPAVVERVRTPSPEDCAIFLADQVKSGSEINKLLRNLNLGEVDITDLKERHHRNPQEYRIDGIKTGITQAKGDRITFLLIALEKSELNHQADLFCREFNIERPACTVQPIQAQGGKSVQRPLQASSPDDFADSPCLEPQSDFETVLQPFLLDPTSIHAIAEDLNQEGDFTVSQLRQFKSAFPRWKYEHRKRLDEKCQSRCTMDVLNVWASIEVERRQGPNTAQGIEFLALALRVSKRPDLLEKLKTFLVKGVVGPSLKRDLYLRDISYLLKIEIVKYLGLKKETGHNDWRALTAYIGHGKEIEFWENERKPAEVLWDVWKIRNDATIGKLYDWAVSRNRLDIAAVLEKDGY